MDRESSSPVPQKGDDIDIRSPRSDQSNYSSSQHSSDSGVFRQSQDDDHQSPTVLPLTRPKPGVSAYDVSKSDTDSYQTNKESIKFNNESFGSPTPSPIRRSQVVEKSPRESNKNRPGIMKRNSRFSVRKNSKETSSESKELKSRLSIHGDIQKEPLPAGSVKGDDTPKSNFYKQRLTLLLTPSQMELIDDKVTKNARPKNRERSFSANIEKGKQRRSKLLTRISNIAARGSVVSMEPDNPAFVFRQLLKKVNPGSLQKAEKDLKRRYVRKLRKLLFMLARFPFQILTPDAFFTLFWNFFILLVVIYDAFAKPFEVCFFSDDRTNNAFATLVGTTAILFTFDILFNFRTAFYDKGVLITDSKRILKEYLRTRFLWDFVAVLADFIAFSFSYDNDVVWYLKLVSFIRFKKLMDLITRIEDFFTVTRAMQASLKMLKLWGTIIVFAHWIACFFYFIAFQQMDYRLTWLHENGLVAAPLMEKYIVAIYWSITTMVTVGYGDVTPVSMYERLYTILAMIIASALFGYSLNTVGTIIKEISYERDHKREKISSVKHYMNQKNLGKNIQTRVKNYIQYIIDSRALYKHDEEEFMGLLSQGLKDEIVGEVNGKILASSQIFAVNFSHKAALTLAKFMKEIFLAPEEVLFQEGDRSDCSIYFIAYGKIQLYHKVKNFNILEKGTHFGEVAFFSGEPRSASAKSLFFSNLYSLARDAALENLSGAPSDFEMFHFIKDRINISQDMTHIEVTCFSCHTRGHLARDCNQIHYVPQKIEVIEAHLKRQEHFRRKFRRKNRERFWALESIPRLSEAAEMMQEDYSDYTVSDEELSQDSLDIILERNLIIIPGAEVNDMKARKVERRNKSNRYSAQALIGEIINANSALATRFSYTSQTVTATKEEHLSSNKPSGPNDLVFFSIDKVENFEVYYPQFNIRTMIQRFEKERLKMILGGSPLGLKALKNFGSLLKDASRRGTRSPLYFTNLQRKNTPQRKRKTLDKSQEYISYASLGKQMQQAIIRQKSLKKQASKKIFEDESDENESTPITSNNERPEIEGDPDDPEIQALVLKRNHSTKDDGTMSKKELHEDKKTVKSKQQVERMEHLVPKTMAKLKLDHSGTLNSSPMLNSSPRLRLINESPPASPTIKKKSSQRSSRKGATLNIFQTRNSLDDKLIIEPVMANGNMEGAILQAMIKEGIDAGGAGGASTRRRRKTSRAYSLEKLDEMKKTIHKFKIQKIIKSIVEATSPVSVTKTANFGL